MLYTPTLPPPTKPSKLENKENNKKKPQTPIFHHLTKLKSSSQNTLAAPTQQRNWRERQEPQLFPFYFPPSAAAAPAAQVCFPWLPRKAHLAQPQPGWSSHCPRVCDYLGWHSPAQPPRARESLFLTAVRTRNGGSHQDGQWKKNAELEKWKLQ